MRTSPGSWGKHWKPLSVGQTRPSFGRRNAISDVSTTLPLPNSIQNPCSAPQAAHGPAHNSCHRAWPANLRACNGSGSRPPCSWSGSRSLPWTIFRFDPLYHRTAQAAMRPEEVNARATVSSARLAGTSAVRQNRIRLHRNTAEHEDALYGPSDDRSFPRHQNRGRSVEAAGPYPAGADLGPAPAGVGHGEGRGRGRRTREAALRAG